jgi:hypothetical protein
MNSTNLTSVCGQSQVPNPPTIQPSCGIPATVGNLSTILRYCCQTSQIGNYSEHQLPTSCFQYCNITSALTYQTVQNCIADQSSRSNLTGFVFSCGPGKNATTSRASQPTHATGHVVWMLLGLAVTGAVLSTEMIL